MDAPNDLSYKPPPEFEEIKKDSLINMNLTDSTELLLIQWPTNQPPDVDGQEVTLKLHHDGHMGSFEDSSGKSYDVVSCIGQEREAMVVFLSSKSETKIVGKISRRVSLIHYPEASELKQKSMNLVHGQRSSATSLTNSSRRLANPCRSNRTRSIMRAGSSRNSETGEPSKSSTKRKHPASSFTFSDQSQEQKSIDG